MNLIPVESSHIAAIGYLEDDRVLLVRYDDGGLYAWKDITASQWSDLLGATSKGKWIGQLIQQRVGLKIAHTASDVNEQASHQQDADRVPRQVDTMLQVLDVDASMCCRKAFRNWPKSDEVDCPDCGTRFRVETIGATRYWRIVPLFAVHRRNS